jgi:two-component system, NarL family, response regulator YdfI
MIRVLVKASSEIARAGLESLLRGHPGFHLAGDSDGATGAGLDSPADVLLVEAASLADPAARDALDWARGGGPAILLVRSAVPPGGIAEALRAGVKAVLPTNLAGPELVAAVEAAATGLVVLDGNDIETLLRAPAPISTGAAAAPVEALTPREIEVLRLLAAGLGNKEIAARLEISEHTVKFHVASIMGKLGAGSRTEAVTLGIRHGLIMI